MKKICIRSLILGVGIGLILVASFNIFLQRQSSPILANPAEDTNSSNYEQALQNMKTGINNNNSGNNINAPEAQEEKNEDPEVAEMTAGENAPIEIKINKGMSSEGIADLLHEGGAIENPQEFIDLAIQLKMTKQFKYGLKQIPHGSSLQEIIEILTKVE